MAEAREETLLSRVHRLEQELEQLKRELLQQFAVHPAQAVKKPSLFGCVQGGDVTEAIIEDAKRSLFRTPDDL